MPQGFPQHFKACQKKQELEKRKAELEAELEEIGE
jgi:hypothetical protein